MITIRLMGGLGNQLFQLTGMLYLRTVLDRSVRCDTSWFDTASRTADTARQYELGDLLTPSERCRLPGAIARTAYSPRNPRAYREQGPDDDLLRRLPARWAFAEGYYQRAAYPALMRAELARRLLPALDGGSSPLGYPVIGVHIRLGDYVTSATTQAHHGVTAGSYFASAVATVRSEVGPLPVRIFTDSPALLGPAHLDQLPDGTEVSTTVGSWEALRDLASCSAIVMSNSSFSWWAAFVAAVLRGRAVPVVMPEPWFSASSRADDLLQVDGWHRLARDVGTL